MNPNQGFINAGALNIYILYVKKFVTVTSFILFEFGVLCSNTGSIR